MKKLLLAVLAVVAVQLAVAQDKTPEERAAQKVRGLNISVGRTLTEEQREKMMAIWMEHAVKGDYDGDDVARRKGAVAATVACEALFTEEQKATAEARKRK